MNIPGSNLLNMALNFVANQQVEYLAFDENKTMPDGSKAPSFKEPIVMRGSFQPVNSMSKQYLGLELNENYANLYICANLLSIKRNKASDRIRFNGKLYQIVSETDWYQIDGWKEVLMIEVTQGADDG